MRLAILFLAAAAAACNGAPAQAPRAGDALAPGDYVTYRFSGAYSAEPVTLREDVVARDGERVWSRVTIVRGRESRRFVVVRRDSPDDRFENRALELWRADPADERDRLPNDGGGTTLQLYDWVIAASESAPRDASSAPCATEIRGARYACTCTQASYTWRGRGVRGEERRCDAFPWTRGPARWWTVDGKNEEVWRAEIVDAGHAAPKPFAMPARAPSNEALASEAAMPAGETWSGVYVNGSGEALHLVQSGDRVRGRWGRPKPASPPSKDDAEICAITPDAPPCQTASAWGELDGTAKGGVLAFSFTSHGFDGHVDGGRGRLVYRASPDAKLVGEYTTAPSDEPMRWVWIKQKGQTPKPESIGP